MDIREVGADTQVVAVLTPTIEGDTPAVAGIQEAAVIRVVATPAVAGTRGAVATPAAVVGVADRAEWADKAGD